MPFEEYVIKEEDTKFIKLNFEIAKLTANFTKKSICLPTLGHLRKNMIRSYFKKVLSCRKVS